MGRKRPYDLQPSSRKMGQIIGVLGPHGRGQAHAHPGEWIPIIRRRTMMRKRDLKENPEMLDDLDDKQLTRPKSSLSSY